MSNHQKDNFSSADWFLQMLTIDWAHISTSIQTLFHRLEDAWRKAYFQKENELEEVNTLYRLACDLLREQRDSNGSPTNISYSKGILCAYQGAAYWVKSKLEDAEKSFQQAMKNFLNSNYGYYNASVVRTAWAGIMVLTEGSALKFGASSVRLWLKTKEL